MPTLQTCASAAARAVSDVPSAIAATRLTNAHAKSEQLAIVLTSFVFIVVISFCLSCVVLAFFDSSLLSCHFRPFTEVLGRIWRFVTRKVWKTARITRDEGRQLFRSEPGR